ncbi:MAG: S-layer homology domain-containing protein [Candidatus Ancillula sp.]|jgi:hypothetical protein|nr:S-layer homology domain-containing protein [Candidatus Ancillula sp.]
MKIIENNLKKYCSIIAALTISLISVVSFVSLALAKTIDSENEESWLVKNGPDGFFSELSSGAQNPLAKSGSVSYIIENKLLQFGDYNYISQDGARGGYELLGFSNNKSDEISSVKAGAIKSSETNQKCLAWVCRSYTTPIKMNQALLVATDVVSGSKIDSQFDFSDKNNSFEGSNLEAAALNYNPDNGYMSKNEYQALDSLQLTGTCLNSNGCDKSQWDGGSIDRGTNSSQVGQYQQGSGYNPGEVTSKSYKTFPLSSGDYDYYLNCSYRVYFNSGLIPGCDGNVNAYYGKGVNASWTRTPDWEESKRMIEHTRSHGLMTKSIDKNYVGKLSVIEDEENQAGYRPAILLDLNKLLLTSQVNSKNVMTLIGNQELEDSNIVSQTNSEIILDSEKNPMLNGFGYKIVDTAANKIVSSKVSGATSIPMPSDLKGSNKYDLYYWGVTSPAENCVGGCSYEATKPIKMRLTGGSPVINNMNLKVGKCAQGGEASDACVKIGEYSFDVIGTNKDDKLSGVCAKIDDTDVGYIDQEGNDESECKRNTAILFLSNNSQYKGSAKFTSDVTKNYFIDSKHFQNEKDNRYGSSLVFKDVVNLYNILSTSNVKAGDQSYGLLADFIVTRNLKGIGSDFGNESFDTNMVQGENVYNVRTFLPSMKEIKAIQDLDSSELKFTNQSGVANKVWTRTASSKGGVEVYSATALIDAISNTQNKYYERPMLVINTDLSTEGGSVIEPDPEPEPIDCEDGYTFIDGVCVQDKITPDPVEPEPEPEPVEPVPEPEPEPEPSPEPVDPEPQPEPEPTPVPEPDPSPQPNPQPNPQPSPLPSPDLDNNQSGVKGICKSTQYLMGKNCFEKLGKINTYKNNFKDLKGLNAEFKKYIKWMFEYGITTGVDKKHYQPTNGVRRDQMAIFVHRLAGGQKTAQKTKNFQDVPKSSVAYKSIAWISEKNVTSGTDKKGIKFSPYQTVTRLQMALFMYRLVGSPKESTKNVNKIKDWNKDWNKEFKQAVNFMFKENVSVGVTVGKNVYYQPNINVTRAQMAAFMFRLHHEVLTK